MVGEGGAGRKRAGRVRRGRRTALASAGPRRPAALAALAAVLGTYALGRRMFGARAALLAALVLASAPLFCAAAHFANPDALLCACTLGALAVFWCDHRAGRRGWFFTSSV